RDKDWCDDAATPVTETCADMVAASLKAAMAILTESHGPAIAGWRWGDAHRALFAHSVFRFVPVLDRLSGLTIATDGDDFTVDRGSFRGRNAADPFIQGHGAGFRAVYDLASLGDSRFVIATGQSGNLLSPHYGDFL